VELIVRAEVRPTESKEKVLTALENIFPNLEFKAKGGFLEGIGKEKNDLAAFKELLKMQQIRDAARSFLMHKVEEGSLNFDLNKQAAFKGKVNFVDFEITLGPIQVKIKDKTPEDLIEWLTEK